MGSFSMGYSDTAGRLPSPACLHAGKDREEQQHRRLSLSGSRGCNVEVVSSAQSQQGAPYHSPAVEEAPLK